MNTEFNIKLNVQDPLHLNNDESDSLSCISIQNGIICPDGHIYDISTNIHYTFNNWYHKPITPQNYQINTTYKNEYILSLIQIWNNFFQHVTFDTLPKLIGITKLLELHANMKILVVNHIQQDLLIQFGKIDPSKIIIRNNYATYFQCKKTFYMNFINTSSKSVKLGSSGYNTISKYLSYTPTRSKKNICYISRGKNTTRILQNEHNIINTLQDISQHYKYEFYHFENPKNIDELKNILINCNLFISMHGGAMGNIIWCHKNTKIIEFIPTIKLKERPCYYYLANTLGLKYQNIEIENFEFDIKTNMILDIEILKNTCHNILQT